MVSDLPAPQKMEDLVNIPEAKAKSILLALCSDDSALARRASEMLGRMEALERRPKRKADSIIKICLQCQDPFHEEDNNVNACRYHDGKWDATYTSHKPSSRYIRYMLIYANQSKAS